MKEKSKKRLGEFLIEDGILTKANLEEALNHQKKEGGLIGQILIKLGYISEEVLIAALGKQLKMPYLPLANYSINAEAVQQFPEEFCKRNLFIAFDQDEEHLYVALGDPLHESLIEEVEKKTQKQIQVFLSTPKEILAMLDLITNTSHFKPLKQAG